MTDLVTRAQLVLLARTLHVPAERLAHLEKLGAARLHELQQRIARRIFDEHTATFRRVGMLVPVIPLSISLPLVQRMVPPMMAGRAAGAVGVEHPKKAAEALDMLDVSYAADCASYLDPRTVGELADVAPPGPVVAITNELLRRGDYVTAGPFLAYATPALIRAVEAGVHDDEGMIRSAAYAYSSASISAVIRQLLHGPTQRIPRLAATLLSGSAELRLTALSVFARCDEDVIAALGDILVDVGTIEQNGDLVRVAVEAGAIRELLTLVGHLGPSALDTLAANPVTADHAVMSALVVAAAERPEPATLRGLVNLLERADTETTRRWGRQLFESAALGELPALVTEARLWPALLRILAEIDGETQTRLGEEWAKLPLADRETLERRVRELRLETRLATLTVTMNIYG
ncbi:hypothetical protein [Nocardia amikacinitolerans]|uniref:hypothetical protein n=1 Tax=Nocardia amikacinitolerans TaxID=756689 RepID=UPI0020A5C480|nr:hypothetical protein [Nocardia amikacinitolerans]MCP2289476.1 hypothetical protein [Nocardia amikacinitolerans]